LDRLKTTVIAAFVIALTCAFVAPAQAAQATAANVQVVSGNGQLICTLCGAYKSAIFFYPMVVKVIDANGNPIAGKAVNWAVVSYTGGLSPTLDQTTTVTDSNGLTMARPFQQAWNGTVLHPSLQSVFSATADNASASFTETLALTDSNSGSVLVTSTLVAPLNATLAGPAGTKGSVPIVIHVAAATTAVPGVAVRILSPEVTSDAGVVTLDPNSPSASCYTDPGADPGSVLTDSNGDATCYPVFGPVGGSTVVKALVGGLDPIEFDQTASSMPLTSAVAYDQFNGIPLTVTQVIPGQLIPRSGNLQTLNPGQSLPLVLQVTDAGGSVAIGGQNVAWTVVSGAATVTPSSSITDSTGSTQTTVTLLSTATGDIIVRAALTGTYSNISTSFTVHTSVTIASIVQVQGNSQTIQAGQKFPLDLIVQVLGTNALPLAGQLVSFHVQSGSATLSQSSALSDSTGRASVTVTAGATAGTATVTAFIGGISVNPLFTLTVIPQGPALTTSSFYNAGGQGRIAAISPCSLVTVIASGLAPNISGTVLNATASGPWAANLANDTVTVASVSAPIYSVSNVTGAANGAEQITFQVPCETATGSSVPVTINVGGGTNTINFPVVPANPGIFETVMSDGIRRAVIIRPDGSFASLANPARGNETVRIIVTGLGPTSPRMATGSVPVPGVDSLAASDVIVGVNNGGAGPNTARVSPNLIGVYEVSLVVPSNAPSGNDIVLSVGVNVPGDVGTDGKQVTRFSNASKIPIQQ
jgi:uncharacterized protein (TIGR03437 family)